MAAGDRALSGRETPGAGAGDPDRGWQLGLGWGAAFALWLLIGAAFAALAFGTGAWANVAALGRDPYLRGVLLFTLTQAFLSALLSVAGAVPLALALHRTRFPGQRLVLRLLLLPQALPVLVGALGILAVWGRNGVVSDGLAALGLPRLDVYGLPGILLAHVFFNMPLATRMAFAALDEVPAESWRLAGQLALSRATVFRLVEWPALRAALPGAASLTFMICVTSFALVLVLGGGPGATTLQVEIYQSLRADFDPGRAVLLALAQIALTAVLLLAAARLGGDTAASFALGRPALRFDRGGRAARIGEAAILVLGLGFVLAPFAAVVRRGLGADLGRLIAEPAVVQAALASLLTAFASACLALALALSLLFGEQAARAGKRRFDAAFLGFSGTIVLVVPPIVLGAGWFLLLNNRANVFALAPVLVILTNAVMATPFAMRIVGPPLAEALARHRRLAAHLGLRGLSRLRHIELPALAAPLALAFALALSLSLGDLGAVALFGSQDFATLPYLLYQRMGSYRTSDAAGLALLLGGLSLGLVLGAERLFARRSRERIEG